MTIITLDSTNGRPDEKVGGPTKPTFPGDDTNLTGENLSTDTQGEFTYDDYAKAHKKVFPGSTDADVDRPTWIPGPANGSGRRNS